MQNIQNFKSNNLYKVKAKNRQAGISMTMILVFIALISAISITLVKLSSDNPNGDKQKIKLDASALIAQAAHLRNSLVLLANDTELAWTAVINTSTGLMGVTNGTTSYTSQSRHPVGPVGTDSAAIIWNYGSYASATLRPTVYAWTSKTLSLALCTAINASMNGGEGTPTVASVAVAAAPAYVSAGATNAFTVSAALATSIDTALGASAALCVDTDGGAYRLLTRINN
jgi:hypothetical protein